MTDRPDVKRSDLRKQLFSAKAKKANSQGIFKDLDEQEWLDFELPDPSAPKAIDELSKMVETR